MVGQERRVDSDRCSRLISTGNENVELVTTKVCLLADMGGAIGGGRGAMAPPIIWLGGPYCIWPPQYFALEFKILTLDLMQREENMFRCVGSALEVNDFMYCNCFSLT